MKMAPRNARCTPGPCRLACRGRDSFGHQLEAKLSCVATAALIGAEYIDIPFVRLRDWEPGLEDVVRFSEAFPIKPQGTTTHSRRPGSSTWWPVATGPLHEVCLRADMADSWFSRVARRNYTCCREHIYVGNNCFDAFHCHSAWPALWQAVAPMMRRLHRSRARPEPVLARSTHDSSTWGAHVVLHVKVRGDRQMRLSPGYYARAIRILRSELAKASQRPPLFHIEAPDGWLDDEAEEFYANLLCRLQSVRAKGSRAPPPPRDVERGTLGPAPLHLVFHRMVSASTLVMARSSLSMAAALLSDGSVIFPRCYQAAKRPLPQWRVLPCSRPKDAPRVPECHRQRVIMDGAEWLRVAMSMVPRSVTRVCEVNTRDGAAGGALLERLPAARFRGFALGNSVNEQPRLNAALESVPSLRKRRVIFFGDLMNTVRAKPQFDGCDIMIVSTRYEFSSEVNNAVVADMPNILQRVAAGGNVLVMHGPGRCEDIANGTDDSGGWCSAWTEMVSRRLVTSAGCSANGPYGHGWCVGRVPTDSACTTRLSLFPTLPIRLDSEPPPVQTEKSAHLQVTSMHPVPRSATAYVAEGWAVEEVRGLRLSSERYFTVLPCSAAGLGTAGAAVCLVFKNHIFESWVGVVVSTDGGRSFTPEPTLVLPTTWHVARMTHNLAITHDGSGRYVIMGGQFKLKGAALCGKHVGNSIPCVGTLPEYNGVWMARGDSLSFAKREHVAARLPAEELIRRGDELSRPGASTWAESARWIFNGTHPGCVERRTRRFAPMARLGACEFDGRLSLVHFRGSLRLYTRSNPAAHGQRFVQTVSSSDGGAGWGSFEFISIDGYDHAQGDAYFFAVSVNPVHNESLLALYPLVHKFHGCIAISASSDGLHWTAPTPLRPCDVHGERTVHHPAEGFVREGKSVSMYIHENVPGTTSDVAPNKMKMDFHPYLRLPPPRLVRHTIPALALRRWTLEALASIK